MRSVSCADSAFHGKKIKISQVTLLKVRPVCIQESVYSQLFEGERISSQ